MREKLIELLKEAEGRYIDEAFSMTMEQREKLLSDGDGYGFYADHLIANGVTIQKWIPVTERLPDKNGEYLVSGAWRGEPAKTWICEFVVIGNVGGWANPARKPVVTHWMPLPEPPKEERAQ